MSLGLYMDVHVPRPITRGLRRRGVDVLRAKGPATYQPRATPWVADIEKAEG